MEYGAKGGIWKLKLNSNQPTIRELKTYIHIIPSFKHIKLSKAGIRMRNSYSIKKI
jgi:hypothetical protein